MWNSDHGEGLSDVSEGILGYRSFMPNMVGTFVTGSTNKSDARGLGLYQGYGYERALLLKELSEVERVI